MREGSINYVFHGLSGEDIFIKCNISLNPDILRIKQEKYALKTARYLLLYLKPSNSHRYHHSSLYIKLQKNTDHRFVPGQSEPDFPIADFWFVK